MLKQVAGGSCTQSGSSPVLAVAAYSIRRVNSGCKLVPPTNHYLGPHHRHADWGTHQRPHLSFSCGSVPSSSSSSSGSQTDGDEPTVTRDGVDSLAPPSAAQLPSVSGSPEPSWLHSLVQNFGKVGWLPVYSCRRGQWGN